MLNHRNRKFSTSEECPGAVPDTINNAQYLRELYFKANPDYEGRFTVPVLWDKKKNTIGKSRAAVSFSCAVLMLMLLILLMHLQVSNESSEIIRMLNGAFNQYLPDDKKAVDFYPEKLRKDIDELNEWVYDTVNNGVYKSGFATSQEACMFFHVS